MVDTVRTSIRARAAISPVLDGCQRSGDAQKYAAFGLGESLQVAAEGVGEIVDQPH